MTSIYNEKELLQQVSEAMSRLLAGFLIDPQGKIIAKNLTGEPLNKRLQELLN